MNIGGRVMKIKLNSRAYIFIGIVIAIIVIIAIVAGGKKDNNEDKDVGNTPGVETKIEGNTKIITGEKLAEKKQFNGLEFSNVEFKIDEKTTDISAEVQNTSSKSTEEQFIDFNVLDKNGNVIVAIGGYIVPLAPGEKTRVSTTRVSEANDTKAYNVEIVEKEKKKDEETTNNEEGQASQENPEQTNQEGQTNNE